MEADLAAQAMRGCRQILAASFDSENGGFATAPKFPRVSEVDLLLREYLRSGDDGAGLRFGSASFRA